MIMTVGTESRIFYHEVDVRIVIPIRRNSGINEIVRGTRWEIIRVSCNVTSLPNLRGIPGNEDLHCHFREKKLKEEVPVMRQRRRGVSPIGVSFWTWSFLHRPSKGLMIHVSGRLSSTIFTPEEVPIRLAPALIRLKAVA